MSVNTTSQDRRFITECIDFLDEISATARNHRNKIHLLDQAPPYLRNADLGAMNGVLHFIKSHGNEAMRSRAEAYIEKWKLDPKYY